MTRRARYNDCIMDHNGVIDIAQEKVIRRSRVRLGNYSKEYLSDLEIKEIKNEEKREYYQKTRENKLIAAKKYRESFKGKLTELKRSKTTKRKVWVKEWWKSDKGILLHNYHNHTYHKTIKGKYSCWKSVCKKTGWDLTMNLEEYKSFLFNNNYECYYCNKNIIDSTGYSLDRLDSNKGYSIDNIVVCCGDCNKIKSDLLTPEEMLEVAKLLNKMRRRKNKNDY